jgi:hypothetical protein
VAGSEEISLRITAKDDASKTVDAVAKKADALTKKPYELEVTADTKTAAKNIDDVLKKADGLSRDPATLLLTSNATQIASQIAGLIGDIDRLDADDPEVTVKSDQVNQLTGDLDKIESKIKEVNTTDVDLNTKPAKQGIDDIGKSADSSKSVLANMIGNTTQDLGALGGVAGSAGVAIGQMGEYMADAAGSGDSLGQIVGNFARVAGPIAAISIATALVSNEFNKAKKASEEFDKEVADLTKTLNDGSTLFEHYADVIKQTGELKLNGDNILPAINDIGLSLKEATDLIDPKTTQAQFDAWVAGQQKVFAGTPQWDSLKEAVLGMVGAREAAIRADEAHKATLEALGPQVNELTQAYNAALNPMKRYADVQSDGADQLDRVNTIMEQAVAGTKAFKNAVGSIDFGRAGLTGAVAGMQQFHDQFFSLAEIATHNEEAFDNFGKSLKENGKSFDLNTEKGRNNQQALQDLSSTIDTQLAAAFSDAHGDFTTFQGKAQDVADTLKTRLQNELHLSGDQADDMIRRLGLMPEDIETRYKLSGTEEAKQKIGLLQSSIDNLPKDVQAKVTQQIIAGDYQGALATVNNYYATHQAQLPTDVKSPTAPELDGALNAAKNYYNNHPVPIPTVIVPPSRARAHGGTVGPEGGIAGEAGAEFATLPDGRRVLITNTTIVPGGTKVTSAARTRSILRHVHHIPRYANGTGSAAAPFVLQPVTVQAAVIGNRFDVQRAVAKALRGHQRYNGLRS